MNLSPNFTLQEMVRSDVAARHGWDNTPPSEYLDNLRRTAELLEKVKQAVGMRPVVVTSGYRSKQVNDAVGSKDTSMHRFGCAADIRVPGLSPQEVVSLCISMNVPYDQIILEFDSWTHVGATPSQTDRPRRQALIIDKAGTRLFSA